VVDKRDKLAAGSGYYMKGMGLVMELRLVVGCEYGYGVVNMKLAMRGTKFMDESTKC
ncbi:hypothetical protein A2U01_0038128, partial [Trifolium medium]|nr:hypothetical protein [Trifolium medium]